MCRSAAVLLAASLALCGAGGFVAPVPAPTTPGASRGSAATAPARAEESTAARRSIAPGPLAVGAALGLLAAVAGGGPVAAADLENGESVFLGNCAACHYGGKNSVAAEKTLKKAAIEKYLAGGYSVDAIKDQVTSGREIMTASGEALGREDIEDVVEYVYKKASNGW